MKYPDRSIVVALFVATITASTCGSCSGAAWNGTRAPRSMLMPSEILSQEMRRAVGIWAVCPSLNQLAGSGVLLDGSRLITALHVVNCAPPGKEQVPDYFAGPASIIVLGSHGEVRSARVRALSVERDIARLELTEVIASIPAVEVADAPGAGDVCVVSADPKRERKCGAVRALRGTDRRIDMGLFHAADTVPGNSGSGVYDEGGRLVAIATRCNSTGCHPPDGGSASLLVDSGVVGP